MLKMFRQVRPSWFRTWTRPTSSRKSSAIAREAAPCIVFRQYTRLVHRVSKHCRCVSWRVGLHRYPASIQDTGHWRHHVEADSHPHKLRFRVVAGAPKICLMCFCSTAGWSFFWRMSSYRSTRMTEWVSKIWLEPRIRQQWWQALVETMTKMATKLRRLKIKMQSNLS